MMSTVGLRRPKPPPASIATTLNAIGLAGTATPAPKTTPSQHRACKVLEEHLINVVIPKTTAKSAVDDMITSCRAKFDKEGGEFQHYFGILLKEALKKTELKVSRYGAQPVIGG